MKHPSGRSLAWAIGGGIAAMFGMAISSPSPAPPNQPLFGVVKPAPDTVYVDKPVYRVPASCTKLVSTVDQYESASSAYVDQTGKARDLVTEMYTAVTGKDVKVLDKKMKEYDALISKTYSDEQPAARMDQAHTQMLTQLARCQRDIKNQEG